MHIQIISFIKRNGTKREKKSEQISKYSKKKKSTFDHQFYSFTNDITSKATVKNDKIIKHRFLGSIIMIIHFYACMMEDK